ncbi:hypothetical protein RFM98_01640 [Mesorhizobium sp. VK9D]|uniref:hypothetical protein n=1 Tax=Mesorhizobium australafricanum TaxID=3072311 RepID=UPI002A23C5EC|nr:hypothetical protein [Mesorhizobium sp. VK9D]MDX8451450.1 hypothetical protein [Mesorhizobium sp. VK9D]
MTIPPDQVRQGRSFMVLPFRMTGHANRDLHRRLPYSFAHDLSPSTRRRPMVSRSRMLAPELFFRYSQNAKVNVMDTRTLLILGLGIAILLLVGFFALPA